MECKMPNRLFLAWMVFGLLTTNSTHGTAQEATDAKKPVVFTVQQDHQNMLQQLGVTKLRPGRSGDEKAPNVANYDEAKANPYPHLPDVMKMASGEQVTTPQQWWETRRPEIVELLEREVYGRIPSNVPHVKWEVRETREIAAGGKPAIQKHIVGVVDNSACPEIEVNISMSLTLPKDAAGPVPVLMSFGWTPFEPSPFAFGGGRSRGKQGGPRPPSREDKFIAAGWGCAIVNPTTVQDDAGGFQRNPFGRKSNDEVTPTGAGLTRGIIGLTNLGQPRKPDDWGALRAWGWGASRGLDYLETEPGVDAKRVGIAGVSRYGKAALVAMAFDQRFAAGLIASSGAGGTKLFRRNFGESLENLASSGGYHWMAGNYMKYSAEESTFGRRTADDLPVDSHLTLALCAPRLTFISHGIPERGDAHWLDHQGSFMAAIAAQPVFRLLGARDLGRSDDYTIEKMPAVNVDMLDGELAWRQHDGGHTDEPNIEHFINWAEKLWAEKEGKQAGEAGSVQSQHQAIERTDVNSRMAHQQLLAKTTQGTIDVYFAGDSITRRWGATDYPQLLANWKANFHGWNAANFAWGGDTTHNILWRLQNGELDGVSPKVIVLQAGTNNLPWTGSADDSQVDDVVTGIRAIIAHFQQHVPDATIVLTAVFPRSQNKALTPTITKINDQLATLTDGKRIRFLNINDKLTDSGGELLPEMASDGLHLSEAGYLVWGEALKPILAQILGPPATEDRAPPATGDPSAAQPVDRTDVDRRHAASVTATESGEVFEALAPPSMYMPECHRYCG
jgi:lysophospholipase L1-like esterase